MERLPVIDSGAQLFSPVSDHSAVLHSRSVNQQVSNQSTAISSNHVYTVHNTEHAAAAHLPLLPHMNGSMLHATASLHPQTNIPASAQSPHTLSLPVSGWQHQQHKDTPGSTHDLEHALPTGHLPWQQPQQHGLQPSQYAQFAQYSCLQQQCQHLQSGATESVMQQNAMQALDKCTQQHPAAPDHSPFSGNPFSDPYPCSDDSSYEQRVTFAELRLPAVTPNLNLAPVQPEVASPPSTPDSFTGTDLWHLWMHSQQQQQPAYPLHRLQRQPTAWFPNMPSARVSSPLGNPANPYSTSSISQHRAGHNLPLDFSSNFQQQQEQQCWSQPPTDYTTARDNAGAAILAYATSPTAAGPANMQQQLSESSKEELVKLVLCQAVVQKGQAVEQLQELLGPPASAMHSTAASSSSSSSRPGAASSASVVYAAGSAAPAYDARPPKASNNPFADLQAPAAHTSSSPVGGMPLSFDRYPPQQHHQPGAGLPGRTSAGQTPGAATVAMAVDQAAAIQRSDMSVPAEVRLPVAATVLKGSDGWAGLMPVTPFANSSAGAQEAPCQRWHQGWHARGDPAMHHLAAMPMQDDQQQLLPEQQQQWRLLSTEVHPTTQRPMLPPSAVMDQRQQQHKQQDMLQPSQKLEIMPASDMWPVRQPSNSIAAQESSVSNTASAHEAVATNFYPSNILAQPAAAPPATAVTAQMQAMMNVTAMTPSAMLVPAALLAAPATAQGPSSLSYNMAFGLFPAVPMAMPVAAAANMQYYQMMQHQQQLYQAAVAAAAAGQTATAASMVPDQDDGISMQATSTMASAGPVGLATTAADISIAGEGDISSLDETNSSLAVQRCSSADASMLAMRSSSCSTAVQMPALFPAAAWPMSASEAAVAWLFGKGCGTYLAQGMTAQCAGGMESTNAEGLNVLVPGGLARSALSVIGRASKLPMAVAVRARVAAAQGFSLAAHSGAAVTHKFFMVCVWNAHYMLVFLLYSLLGMTSVVVASQQLVIGAGKLTAVATVQLGLFAARQARLFTSAAVWVVSSDLEKLSQQLLLQPLVSQPMLRVHSKQLLFTEEPSGVPASAPVVLEEEGKAATADFSAVSVQASDTSRINAGTLPSCHWPQAVLRLFMSSGSSNGTKPGSIGTAATATTADAHDTSSSEVKQQQLVSLRTGSTASAAALGQSLRVELQQQYNLHVADSVSVISGLWMGLGIKLWVLVTIRVPLEASRIWVQACGQGAIVSAAAAAAATQYVMHAAWLLVQCSALILANTRLHLPQAGAAALTLAGRVATAAAELSYQVVLFWWVQLSSHATAAAQAMLKSIAESVPGGMGLLQCLNASAGCACYAVHSLASGMAQAWQWLACADEQAWKSLTMHSMLTQLMRWGLAAAAWGGGEMFGLAEKLSVAATTRVLHGAPPMAQAAVWGSAGMLKRLALEALQQSCTLLLGLYHVWQEQQQQQQ